MGTAYTFPKHLLSMIWLWGCFLERFIVCKPWEYGGRHRKTSYRLKPLGELPDYGLDATPLSLERARNVQAYLIDTLDVSDIDIAVRGAGESEPTASNETPEGRRQNRRVEFIF